jgi:hypothetical protein
MSKKSYDRKTGQGKKHVSFLCDFPFPTFDISLSDRPVAFKVCENRTMRLYEVCQRGLI